MSVSGAVAVANEGGLDSDGGITHYRHNAKRVKGWVGAELLGPSVASFDRGCHQ